MRLLKRFFWIMIPFIGIVFLFVNSDMVEARKYYSLKDIGLSGCTMDSTDYTILSIRGNTIKYMKYQLSKKTREWKLTGGIQIAKLTSKTKYYVGDSKKVSNTLKRNTGENKDKNEKRNSISNKAENNKEINNKWSNKKRLNKKNINTEKWIYRVRKSVIRKNMFGRNNEIRIKNGRVTKLVVRLAY